MEHNVKISFELFLEEISTLSAGTFVICRQSYRSGKTRFFRRYIAPFLDNCVLHLVQTSFGTSTHSSLGSSLGTSLVTCLQVRWGSKEHCSFGASCTTV